MNRSFITKSIQDLAADAQVAPEKCNPRCMRKLYQTTRDEIKENLVLLLEQSYERLLEAEQLTAGWDDGPGGLTGALSGVKLKPRRCHCLLGSSKKGRCDM